MSTITGLSTRGCLIPLSLLISSCAQGPSSVRTSGAHGGIDSLHVFGVPVALDLDGRPGPDAFGITVYASAGGAARGVAVTSGRVEVLMYDGTLPSGDGSTNAVPTPRRQWSLTLLDLNHSAIKSSLGVGYRLTPSWDDTPPRRSSITVVVRYLPTRGNPVVSAPVTIAVVEK